MNVIDQFERLDNLIAEVPASELKTKLRNVLMPLSEQVAAFVRDSQTKAELRHKVASLEQELAKLRAQDEPTKIQIVDPLGPPTYERE
jgi:hypothetical protein